MEAKQEALDQAVEQATRRLAEDLLGAERTAQHWSQVGPKVLKSSARYVLFVKAAVPVDTPDGSKISVQMRISPDNLESLLREMGLFAGGTVRLLPLISVTESRGSKYVWWADTNNEERTVTLAQGYFKKIFQSMNAQFKGKSVFVLDPSSASFRMSVPSAYRIESLRREDQALLGQYLKADVILTGRVDISRVRPDSNEQRISYGLQLWQAKNSRVVGEATRTEGAGSDVPKVISAALEQANKKVFSEMAGKLSEAVAGGNLNLGVLRVTVIGSLSFRQQNEFRKQLGDVREVRAVKERLFEPSRVTYEVETQANGSELAKFLQKARFTGFTVSVDSAHDNGLVLGVRATSAQ